MRFKEYLLEASSREIADLELQKLAKAAHITQFEKCPDGRIDVLDTLSFGMIALSQAKVCKDGRTLLNIRHVKCNQIVDMSSGFPGTASITQWDNMPESTIGGIYVNNSSFGNDDMKYLPTNIGALLGIFGNKVTSLVGIDRLKFCPDPDTGEMGKIELDPRVITRGGLGLLMCENFGNVYLTNEEGFEEDYDKKNHKDHNHRSVQAFLIIQKHAMLENSLFDCQTELIDNGLEEFTEI